LKHGVSINRRNLQYKIKVNAKIKWDHTAKFNIVIFSRKLAVYLVITSIYMFPPEMNIPSSDKKKSACSPLSALGVVLPDGICTLSHGVKYDFVLCNIS